jgi:hypothetical protein
VETEIEVTSRTEGVVKTRKLLIVLIVDEAVRRGTKYKIIKDFLLLTLDCKKQLLEKLERLLEPICSYVPCMKRPLSSGTHHCFFSVSGIIVSYHLHFDLCSGLSFKS